MSPRTFLSERLTAQVVIYHAYHGFVQLVSAGTVYEWQFEEPWEDLRCWSWHPILMQPRFCHQDPPHLRQPLVRSQQVSHSHRSFVDTKAAQQKLSVVSRHLHQMPNVLSSGLRTVESSHIKERQEAICDFWRIMHFHQMGHTRAVGVF